MPSKKNAEHALCVVDNLFKVLGLVCTYYNRSDRYFIHDMLEKVLAPAKLQNAHKWIYIYLL